MICRGNGFESVDDTLCADDDSGEGSGDDEVSLI